MKLEFNQKSLEDAFFYVNQVAKKAKNAAAPQYKCIQFAVKNKRLRMYACDGSHLCEVAFIDVDVPDCSYMVEYSLIDDLVDPDESETIVFDFKESSLVVSAGGGEYSMPYFPDNDFSYLLDSLPKDLEPYKVCEIQTLTLKEVLTFLGASLPRKDEYAHLRGVYFDGNFVSTNGISCGIYHFDDPIKSAIYLSLESFTVLASIVKDDVFTLYLVGDKVLAKKEDVLYQLSAMAQDFPAYANAKKKADANKLFVEVDREKLIKLLKKLLKFSSAIQRNSTQFKFSAEKLIIETGSEGKKAREEIALTRSNVTEEIVLSLNIAHLIAYLGNLGEPAASISFDEKSNLVKVLDSTNKEYLETKLI